MDSNSWLLLAGIGSIIGLFVAYTVLDGIVFLPRRRRRFCRGRQPMPDDVFAANMNVPADDAGHLASVRKAFAGVCGVPAAMLHDTDDWAHLNTTLIFDGLDTVALVMELEEYLHQEMPDPAAEKIPVPRGKQTFGAWAVDVVGWLKKNRFVPAPDQPQSE